MFIKIVLLFALLFATVVGVEGYFAMQGVGNAASAVNPAQSDSKLFVDLTPILSWLYATCDVINYHIATVKSWFIGVQVLTPAEEFDRELKKEERT